MQSGRTVEVIDVGDHAATRNSGGARMGCPRAKTSTMIIAAPQGGQTKVGAMLAAAPGGGRQAEGGVGVARARGGCYWVAVGTPWSIPGVGARCPRPPPLASRP